MINNNWDDKLSVVFNSNGFANFLKIVDNLYATKNVYPAKENLFRALKLTDYDDVKVVIIGQDPYHEEGQAMGLSFSVPNNVSLPPSLQNIYKELYDDLKIKKDKGDLSGWAKEGVLLLNSILTVEKSKALSHKDLGWELFTDYIIKVLNLKSSPVVFILWGNFAKSKEHLITNKHHYIIKSPHPSPFSAYSGFFGSKPFSKTNEFLIKNKIKPIDWSR